MPRCEKHQQEPGKATCRRCGGHWCDTCVVYAYGPQKDPYCVSCAMVAGGVRCSGARPTMSKRDLRAQAKTERQRAKIATITPPNPLDPALEPAAIDWSSPWWEDRQPA